jgi:hypothetical protein
MKKQHFLVILLVLFFAMSGLISFLQAAEIIYLEGNVQIQPVNAEEWKKADKGMQLNIGDAIRTARHSRADIALDEEKKNIIRIDPRTQAVLNSNTSGIDRLDLSRGKVYANLENLKAGMEFEVTTPSAVAGVRGSSYSTYVERDTDEVQAFKDSVYIKAFDTEKNMLSETTLPEGFKTLIDRFDAAGAITQVSEREFERFDRMLEELTGHAEGKDQIRAEREKAAREAAKGEGKSTTEQTGQVDDQQAIADEVSKTKELTEESNVDKIIEERSSEHEEMGWW